MDMLCSCLRSINLGLVDDERLDSGSVSSVLTPYVLHSMQLSCFYVCSVSTYFDELEFYRF